MKWINEPALDVLVHYYYPRAKYLQINCNWGQQGYRDPETMRVVNDELMTSVDIYDCYTRDAAGFSNVLQDLKLQTNTPKWHHQDDNRRRIIEGYDTAGWDTLTWFYAYMCHRFTGSGASFTRDHGYRNSAVQHWGSLRDIKDMQEHMIWLKASGKPLFTSIGNQPPAPRKGTSCLDFMVEELEPLLASLLDWLEKGKKKTHKEVVDYLNTYNIKNGHRRFNFSYAAFSYDLGDYHKDLVDDMSHGYFGNNAVRCMKVLSKGYSTDEFMDLLCDRIGGAPRDNEDVMCDFVRFGQNYVPRNDDTFSHIPNDIKNNSGWVSGWDQRQGEPKKMIAQLDVQMTKSIV